MTSPTARQWRPQYNRAIKAAPEPTTKAGEVLDIEEQYLYPFLKSTDIFRGRQSPSRPTTCKLILVHKGLIDNWNL